MSELSDAEIIERLKQMIYRGAREDHPALRKGDHATLRRAIEWGKAIDGLLRIKANHPNHSIEIGYDGAWWVQTGDVTEQRDITEGETLELAIAAAAERLAAAAKLE